MTHNRGGGSGVPLREKLSLAQVGEVRRPQLASKEIRAGTETQQHTTHTHTHLAIPTMRQFVGGA